MFRSAREPGTAPAMVVRDRSFSRGTPVCDYWLAHCEGFELRAGGRSLGVVEAVEATDAVGRAEELLVRRRRRRHTIATGRVLAVVPARKVVLARREPSFRVPDLRPALRSAYTVVKPVAVSVARTVAVLVWALALRLGSELTALVRAAGNEIRDYKRERDLERNQERKRRQQDRHRLPDGQLDSGRRRRGETPGPQLEQGLTELARRLRRIEDLAGRLPRRAQMPSRSVQVRRAELEHPGSVANGYLFALGDDRLDVGGEDQRPTAVDQP
jgi:signal transduction histidine kinase